MDPRQKQQILADLLLTLALLVLLALGLLAGSTRIPTGEVLTALFKPAQGGMSAGIVRNIRLPRALAAVLLGGALSVAGFLLQTFFGNPIAGPFVLGISSGSKLCVAITMIVALRFVPYVTSWMMVLSAFAGALLAMGFVLLSARSIRQMSMLLVAGIMISYICSAVTEFVITFAQDSDIVNLHTWSQGSFSGTKWEDVTVFTWIIALCAAAVFLLAKPISAYQLGESYAQSMGVNVKRFRVVLILLPEVILRQTHFLERFKASLETTANITLKIIQEKQKPQSTENLPL